MNKFIVFEGIDGSGKTTQIKLLQEKFNSHNISYSFFREPGGDLLSEQIREILLDNKIHISDISETMLFLAARAQLTSKKIKPALDKNEFVICDRFSDSTFAYQGYGKEVDSDIIQILNKFVTNNLEASLTVLLDITYEDSLNRRGKTIDRMENNSKYFFNRVRSGYKELASQHSNRYLVLDAMLDVDTLHNLIWVRISKDFSL